MEATRYARTGAAFEALANPTAASSTWWRFTSADRRHVWLAVLLALALSAGTAATWQWQQIELTDAREMAAAQQDRVLEQRKRAEAAARAMVSSPRDWWSELLAFPATAGHSPIEQLSTDALALAPKLGVDVLRLTFSVQPQVSGAPYRSTTMQVELRGPYSEVKRWLGELLARRPHSLVLKSIDLRRTAEGAAQPGVDASVELRLYERATSATR